jgi:M61 glycyl aminopeptidase
MPLGAADLTVTDSLGKLALTQHDEPTSTSVGLRRWLADRDTVGDLCVEYIATPRAVDESTQMGPLFDLRTELGGLIGAGVTFIAVPATARKHDIFLQWDLSGAPAGTRASSSLGEGPIRMTGTVNEVASSFYAVGQLRSYPDDARGPFAMYWITEPNFDPVAVARLLHQIYLDMCHFFKEPQPAYRVFMRCHRHHGRGGTALPRSFAFGYSQGDQPTAKGLTALLAHETVHNWVQLDGLHKDTAWYVEGAAEYYGLVLPFRRGLLTDQQFASLLNERARGYFSNPLQVLSNTEAAKFYWHDLRAFLIPNGRGLFYFIDLDAKLRSRSRGAISLDDLILEVLRRRRSGHAVRPVDWAALVTAELGDQGRADYEALQAGRRIIPPPGALGPRFTLLPAQYYTLDLGFDFSSLRDRVVTGLVVESAAALAGLREGDRIVEAPPLIDVARGRCSEISLVVQRGPRTLHVTYAPRGTEVCGCRWQAG